MLLTNRPRPPRQKFSTPVVANEGVREKEGEGEILTSGLFSPRWSTNHYGRVKRLHQATQVSRKKLLSHSPISWLPPSCLKWIMQPVYSKRALKYLSFGILSAALNAIPALGAERLTFSYPPFGEFYLSTKALDTFAKQGKITDDFAFYAKRTTPQQLAQLRDLLSRRFEVSPTLVSQFTYSPLGETVMRRLGGLLQTDARQNGFYALRSALILAAADPEGLTVLNILRRFPTRSVRLDLNRGLKIVGNLSELLKQREAIVGAIQQEAIAEASAQPPVNFSQQPDLRQKGLVQWQQETLVLEDRSRNRRLPVDLYLPQLTGKQLAPVVVISHGMAEDRTTFAYLAQHLASYGFAVAVLEHPGTSSQRFQQFFAGLAGPPEPRESVDQPLDVKYVLDELQRRSQSDLVLNRLNLQQVGIIGHSHGGYAALTLAGATINFDLLHRNCDRDNFLNMSLLVQCKTVGLPPANYPLRDERVKAVIAVNPLSSSILGQRGLSQIQVPVMLVAGSQDVVTPAVPEQIRPFTWLTVPDHYLALIEHGTHFSVLPESTIGRGVFPVLAEMVGADPALARSYLNALSVAFLQTHLANRPDYRSYLSASYARFVSQAPLNLSLVKSFTTAQLEQAAKKVGTRSIVNLESQPLHPTP